MQAARNWRDEFEERDKDGDTVLDVWYTDGKPRAYAFRRREGSVEFVTGQVSRLILKPRPKTLRPYRRGEVKCGDVFRDKRSGVDTMVTAVSDNGVMLGHHPATSGLDILHRDYTHLDGTPAGVEE